ncbi:MAG: hypothetical protein PHY12_07455 [Eubacteriales bacterium]|nr:hypothetical protein [Eubacteriales bacterium]
MTYWEKVASRLSVPGLALIVVGALLCAQAQRLCTLAFKEKGARLVLPAKIAGVALALLGALIMLDFIPGL